MFNVVPNILQINNISVIPVRLMIELLFLFVGKYEIFFPVYLYQVLINILSLFIVLFKLKIQFLIQ